MILASAQIKAEVGKIEKNLEQHIKMIWLATEQNADIIIFPEMSLTGYCREEAKRLAISIKSKYINLLENISKEKQIIIVVGAPVVIDNELYIGSFVIQPNKPTEIYTKQYLHDGEELFFKSSFDYNPTITINDDQLHFAICADIDNEKHPEKAASNNCNIYLPSIFFSENGIQSGHKTLEDYSKKYNLHILMSNFCGEHWNINAGGRSAFWNNNGKLLCELDNNSPGIIIAEKKNNETWNTKSIQV
ncbi:carbon-nitrogen hydrolase family protein [Tenacibaculum sp. M341]|uniref:carbon-nitrogen hydrolase family protein n=1 Tax=Tenacibaculum sp. M341 TaxID=2530339 RepID=UPI00104F6055|nr:carbon-nitrogen hydrolase family protein [Tenacibaculum sp. M341]TCI93126.1 carbon-nitrogen hydrolase family protein [Tenacibaculum sp. M341]